MYMLILLVIALFLTALYVVGAIYVMVELKHAEEQAEEQAKEEDFTDV